MPWTRVNRRNAANRAKYLNNLKRCTDYAGNDTEEILDKVIASGCEVWYWTGRGCEISLAIRINRNEGTAKIVTGVPSPEGEPEDWCEIMISQIRKRLDRRNIETFSAVFKESYNDDHINEFCEYIDRVCWEVHDNEIRNEVGKCIHFRRPANRRNEDSEFRGRERDRELPKKIRDIQKKRGREDRVRGGGRR